MTEQATKCPHLRWRVDPPPVQTHLCLDCGHVVKGRHPLEGRGAFNHGKTETMGEHPHHTLRPASAAMRDKLLAMEVDDEEWIDHGQLECKWTKKRAVSCGLARHAAELSKSLDGAMDWAVTCDGNHDATVRRIL